MALSGIRSGVTQLKLTFNGMGIPQRNLSLETLFHALQIRGDAFAIHSRLQTEILQRTCKQIAHRIDFSNNGHSAFGHFCPEPMASTNAVPELSAASDRLSVERKLRALGYDLPDAELERVYSRFRLLAAQKKVYDRDLEALVAEAARQGTPMYQLANFVINSGNRIKATAYVQVEKKDGETVERVSTGDGPIDAAFQAIEQIFGRHYELEDFQIQSVTEGREALGDTLVKIRHNGKLYSGRGLSTDVVAASIGAYLNAVNKIAHEEGEK